MILGVSSIRDLSTYLNYTFMRFFDCEIRYTCIINVLFKYEIILCIHWLTTPHWSVPYYVHWSVLIIEYNIIIGNVYYKMYVFFNSYIPTLSTHLQMAHSCLEKNNFFMWFLHEWKRTNNSLTSTTVLCYTYFFILLILLLSLLLESTRHGMTACRVA